MYNIVKRIGVSVVLALAAVMPAASQEPYGKKEAQNALAEISGQYDSWKSASWQGKVRTDMLPLSPTMKVYMECGKRTSISLRVPIMGEVARIEVDKDSVLLANKMKRVYWSAPMAEVSKILPDFLNESQELMLGRGVAIGKGLLSKKMAGDVDVYGIPGGGFLVVPELPEEMEGFNYGYAFDDYGRMIALSVSRGKTEAEEADKAAGDMAAGAGDSLSFAADIDYDSEDAYSGAKALLHIQMKGKNMTATLEVGKTECGGKGFDRFIPGRNYRRVGLRECLKFLEPV